MKDKTKMFLWFTDDLFMTWTGSERELLDLNEWFEQETSFDQIWIQVLTNKKFLDVLVCKDRNNMLQSIINRKQTDQQNYLDTRSEYLKFLKDSIPCSQALQIKRNCSSQQEFLLHT